MDESTKMRKRLEHRVFEAIDNRMPKMEGEGVKLVLFSAMIANDVLDAVVEELTGSRGR